MRDELNQLLTHHSSLITHHLLMIIARILGTVVSTQKDERLLGKKLLIVRPLNTDGTDMSGYVVAVDTVGAGFHERVLVVAGSSARLAQGMKDVPVDAAIVGVIDTVDISDS
jgi:ethanolamine utilization protein EutN